jgi:hypothetical protein
MVTHETKDLFLRTKRNLAALAALMTTGAVIAMILDVYWVAYAVLTIMAVISITRVFEATNDLNELHYRMSEARHKSE